MYHRVVPVELGPAPTWNVTPEKFRQQLTGLLDAGYQPCRLTDLITAAVDDHFVRERTFVVTFDDGYANNALYATPILKDLGIPATVFLATRWLNTGSPFCFDDWELKGASTVHPDTWRPATLDQCEQMLNSGVIEFGSHTHSHADFRDRMDLFRWDLQISVDNLRQRFGIQHPALSLPYGIIDRGFAGPDYAEVAAEIGCCCCLSTEEELVDIAASPFQWGRFIAQQHDTAASLAVKLDGWRDSMKTIFRRLRGR